MTRKDGKFLLDTNIIIAFFEGEDNVVNNIINGNEILLPVIALGELHFGAQKSLRTKENISNINKLKKRFDVTLCDERSAEIYGIIKTNLFSKGRPIPDNDIWIAAMAMQHNLTLVTRDKHFWEVDGLQIVRW